MGMTSYAKLIFGCDLGDEDAGLELPWDTEEFDHDLEGWWRTVKGYKPPFELYNSEGARLPIWTAEKRDELYHHRKEFDEENPCPVEINYIGHPDFSGQVLSTKSHQIFRSEWSEALEIKSEDLFQTSKMEATLQAFCAEYGIKPLKGPCWILGAYYG